MILKVKLGKPFFSTHRKKKAGQANAHFQNIFYETKNPFSIKAIICITTLDHMSYLKKPLSPPLYLYTDSLSIFQWFLPYFSQPLALTGSNSELSSKNTLQ